MLALPLKADGGSTDVIGGVMDLIRATYGRAAAATVLEDIASLRRARERAASARVGGPKDAEAAQVSLLLYHRMLARLHSQLGGAANDATGAITFCWRSCWGESEKATESKLDFEQSCVLFNLAAALSAAGAHLCAAAEENAEGIKAAARSFQLAAGALQEVGVRCRELSAAALTADLSIEALGAASDLMVAQAQACFCVKAEKDGMAHPTQAKLCMGAAEQFGAAAKAMGECASNKGLRKLREWGEAVAGGRRHEFEAAARWHAAHEDGGERIGVRQALLQLASASAGAAAAALPEGGGPRARELAARVGEDLAKVTRDNSLVYYESVPEAGALPPIAPKLLAKPAGATQPAGLPGLLAGWLDQLTRPAE